MGGGLIFISLFAIAYGFYSFYGDVISIEHGFTLENIFKPVIALTLALAFFDLGKTIILHEVFSKSESLEVFDAKSFITFLTSIMIALLIEALLSVFKISLDGYEKMPYAAMLIVSLALLFFVFAWFIIHVGIWTKPKDK
jgi:chromate transport protein ChrA